MNILFNDKFAVKVFWAVEKLVNFAEISYGESETLKINCNFETLSYFCKMTK